LEILTILAVKKHAEENLFLLAPLGGDNKHTRIAPVESAKPRRMP
jgi:hypothetical protein